MLTNEQTQTFAKEGYLLLEEIVPKTLVEEIRYEAKIHSEKELGVEYGSKEEVWDIDTRLVRAQFQKIIQRLLDLPTLREPVQKLIGSDIHLLLCATVVVRAVQGRIYWHQDSDAVLGFIAEEFNLTDGLKDIDFSLMSSALLGNTMGVAIFLQDTSDALGPMRVIPGSHRWEHSPNDPYANSLPGEVHLPLPTGAAVFHEPSIWHTLGVNTSATDCWIFGLYYRNSNIQPVLNALKGKI